MLISVHASADPVSVRVSKGDGYGRIAFSWPAPVPFTASISNRQLVVAFGRPVQSNFDGIPGAISQYVGRPSLQNGGRTVVFPLRGNYDLNYNQRGRTVTVDVVDLEPPPRGTSAAATAPAPAAVRTAPAAARPVGAEAVGVRTGAHADYQRLVFDWKKSVGYKIARRGNRADIIFARPAQIELGRVRRGRLANVPAAEARVGASETTVTLSVPSSSKIRHFKSGPKVVVDIYNPTGANDARAAASQPAPKAAASTASARPAAKIPAQAKSAAKSPTKSVKAEPLKAPAALVKAPAALGAKGKLPVALAPPTAKPVPSVAAKSASAPAPAAAPPTGPPAASASLRFDWSEPVGSAVFRRAGSLWIVFDKSKKIDAAKVRSDLKNIARSVTQIPSPGGTFLRLITEKGFNPSIRRDGFAWIFDFKKQGLSPGTPIEPKSQPNSPGGARMLINVAQAGEALPIRDQVVGDNLVVVPFIPLAHGIDRQHALPQFRILPSAQGMVIKPYIDNLRVQSMPQGVALSSTGRLVLSSLSPKTEVNAKLGGGFKKLSRAVPANAWRVARRVKGIGDFIEKRAALFEKVTSSKRNDRQKRRLALAQFLAANKYGYEAIGILSTMVADEPALESNAEFRLTRGITNFMIDRLDEAEKDFSQSSLDGNDEGEFWRAVVMASKDKAIEAAGTLKKTGSVFKIYPRHIKMRVGMVVSNAAVSAGDVKFAAEYLGVLAEEKPTGTEIDQLALIEGRVNQISGNFDAAVSAWEEVESGDHRPSVARAILLRTDLLLGRKKIEADEAAEELEKLRFSWRGGDFEYDLLRKLGSLHIKSGDYRNGLRTLRQAVTYFKDKPTTGNVTKEMAKAFADLYLNDKADSMQPVRAIALFEEYKELTPSGADGEEMIRKLADRLAAVDLLGPAAKLLEEQIKSRLKGVERARVGARLAAIYLLNKQPKLAREGLQKSASADLPPEIAAQRRLLSARALMEMNQSPSAIALLEDDDSREADLLRSEIFWKDTDWANATKPLHRLVRSMGVGPGDPLDEIQAQTVLNLAVALALSGNERGIGRLREDHAAAMDATEFKDAFRLIASPNTVGLLDYRTVASKVATVNNFKSFMSTYRERLKSGKLSSLN
ncbi:MAG: hypothetical protein HOI98_05570 [Rhodospirillaceae bacterium]|nr:hypothetical protein [Rhodospirillaceae bacterium]MBT7570058.1 hypothetical protein [Rhodospirillaceae bacterium]